MGRPKKYKTEDQQKKAQKSSRALLIKGKYFRLVIPHLSDYNSQTIQTLKGDTLQLLLQHQNTLSYSLQYYCVSAEKHPSSGIFHLDIFLTYDKSHPKSLNRFNYLIKHGNLTRYATLNQAIIQYSRKQDKLPLTNLPQDTSNIVDLHKLQQDPYAYLYDRMKQDPLHFNLQQYVQKNQLSKNIRGWSSLKVKLKDMQVAAANLLLKSKPGFKFIDRVLIQSQLSSSQLKLYDSWSGYQTIVDHLNQIPKYGYDRQQKTSNLLVSGAPDTGKSALVWQRNPLPGRKSIFQSCSVYPMGMSQWFPKYQSQVYQLIYWNEMKLTSYSYDTILKLLDGSPLDLSNKGSVSRKVDNPLVLMTSNLTLQQMIQQKFGYNKKYVQMARKNLAVRVTNVVIPENYDLFILQKILVR